jgi:acetyl esterase/lipase
MAICYVGPRNAPDLTKDHHISPIFTPSSILARFPPVYLVCGEKDPFVDDTVIIAGKIREAKQQRKTEALLKLRKGNADPTLTPMKLDPILEEEEADWVQMR